MTFKINPEKIRDVIGKGGAVIRALTEETGTTIDIQDDGMVTIASVNADACNVARKRIEDITADVEVGRIYNGTVLKLVIPSSAKFQRRSCVAACFVTSPTRT